MKTKVIEGLKKIAGMNCDGDMNRHAAMNNLNDCKTIAGVLLSLFDGPDDEHAALVAVAQAAEQLRFKTHNFSHGCEDLPELECNLTHSLANLKALRNRPAAVKYDEALFLTKVDAEFWIDQERRKSGFHVIETVKAGAGLKVVFERRKEDAK